LIGISNPGDLSEKKVNAWLRDMLLLALIESVKLAVGAEDENVVNAVGNEGIEEPFQTWQVEIAAEAAEER
jgi:hypothetical protein